MKWDFLFVEQTKRRRNSSPRQFGLKRKKTSQSCSPMFDWQVKSGNILQRWALRTEDKKWSWICVRASVFHFYLESLRDCCVWLSFLSAEGDLHASGRGRPGRPVCDASTSRKRRGRQPPGLRWAPASRGACWRAGASGKMGWRWLWGESSGEKRCK